MSINSTTPRLASVVLGCLKEEPGLTDREITDRVFGKTTHPSQVNQTCRLLMAQGAIWREQRGDGKIGNYLPDSSAIPLAIPKLPVASTPSTSTDTMSEDQVKQCLAQWLESANWRVEVAWGKARGIDIVAQRDDARWVIEVKGCGSLPPMRVNYFLSMLGETLQRMSDPKAKYSIALPDIAQFRSLWKRLPDLAKQRTGISALFVTAAGEVSETEVDRA